MIDSRAHALVLRAGGDGLLPGTRPANHPAWAVRPRTPACSRPSVEGDIRPASTSERRFMTAFGSRPPQRRRDLTRTIGATITSCAGAGSAATIYAVHGNSPVALLVFGSMQIWTMLELVLRWRMRSRYSRLFEIIARKAADHPDNMDLRTLLVDIASTHLDELGERLPVRKDLK